MGKTKIALLYLLIILVFSSCSDDINKKLLLKLDFNGAIIDKTNNIKCENHTIKPITDYLDLTGIEDYILIPSNVADLNCRYKTISFWCLIKRINKHSETNQIIDKTHQSDYSLFLEQDGRINFRIHNGYEYKYLYKNNIYKPVLNEWHHIVIVKLKNQVSLYIDNIIQGTIDINEVYSLNVPLLLGAGACLDKNTNYHDKNFEFDGFIDDFRIYNITLNTDQISIIYESGRH